MRNRINLRSQEAKEMEVKILSEMVDRACPFEEEAKAIKSLILGGEAHNFTQALRMIINANSIIDENKSLLVQAFLQSVVSPTDPSVIRTVKSIRSAAGKKIYKEIIRAARTSVMEENKKIKQEHEKWYNQFDNPSNRIPFNDPRTWSPSNKPRGWRSILPIASEEVIASDAINFLGLSYSTKDLAFHTHLVRNILRRGMLRISFPGKEQFEQAIDIIRQKRFTGAGNRNFSIMQLPGRRHAAYFLIEYNQNDFPLNLSYIDGNGPLSNFVPGDVRGKKYSVVTFEVNHREPRLLFEAHLLRTFAHREPKEYYTRDHLFELLSQVVRCDDSNRPIIVSEENPTHPQNRGNCSLKTIHALIKLVLNKLNPRMTFNTADSQGTVLYKGYKQALIELFFNDLAGLVENHQELRANSNLFYIKPSYFNHAINTLRECSLKAVFKDNDNRLNRVALILQREKGEEIWKAEIADINEREEEVRDAEAVEKQKLEILQSVLESVENLSSEEREEIERLIAESNLYNLADKLDHTFLIAVRAGHLELIETLEYLGAGTKQDSLKAALIEAANRGNKKIAEHILQKGIDVNFNLPLRLAAESGDKEMVNLFLQAGADVNFISGNWERTALLGAIINNRKEVAQLLLHNGADVNLVGAGWSESQLMAAARIGDEEMVNLLLQAGADVNFSHEFTENTALLSAIKGRHRSIVEILLKYGAEVNVTERRLSSPPLPLVEAVNKGVKEIVEILLLANADVNATTEPAGTTALSLAVIQNKLEITRLLLDRGAKVTDSVFQSARGRKKMNKEILDLLETAAARQEPSTHPEPLTDQQLQKIQEEEKEK